MVTNWLKILTAVRSPIHTTPFEFDVANSGWLAVLRMQNTGLVLVCAAAVSLLLPDRGTPSVAPQDRGTQITVAAAADLSTVLPTIVAEFERQTGTKVRLVIGSSGSLSAQIRNGAPFDVFLSADVDYPRQLIQNGFAAAPYVTYATGRLAVWVPKNSPLPVEKLGSQALLSDSVKRVAIANPDHAPYGRAAVGLLKQQHLFEQLAGKLVMGENIAQTMQFVISGNAQAGIVSLSLALTPQAQAAGRYQVLPVEFGQAGVVLKNSSHPEAAHAFLTFLLRPPAEDVFRSHGLELSKTKP